MGFKRPIEDLPGDRARNARGLSSDIKGIEKAALSPGSGGAHVLRWNIIATLELARVLQMQPIVVLLISFDELRCFIDNRLLDSIFEIHFCIPKNKKPKFSPGLSTEPT